MIEKLFTAPKAGITDEEYHEKIKYQTNFWTSIIVLAVIITMILASLQNASDSRSFFHGFFGWYILRWYRFNNYIQKFTAQS